MSPRRGRRRRQAGRAEADAGRRRPRCRGNATPALLKKLAALGADASAVASLRRENDGKADILFYDSLAKGATLAEGLQKAVEAALAALPIPKVMTYQLADGWSSVNFVRPAHALVALHGSDVVPVSVLGLNSGRATKGHRFRSRRRSGRDRRRRQLRRNAGRATAPSSPPSPSAAPKSPASSPLPPPRPVASRSTTTPCSTKSPRWSNARTCWSASSRKNSSPCRRNA
jgi:hypothetical protein